MALALLRRRSAAHRRRLRPSRRESELGTTFRAGQEGGGIESGGRAWYKLSGTAGFRQPSPSELPLFELHFSGEQSVARAPLSPDVIRLAREDAHIPGPMRTGLSRQSGVYDHLGLRINFSPYKGLKPFVDSSIDMTAITGDEVAGGASRTEVGVAWPHDAVLPGFRTETSILTVNSPAKVTDRFVKDAASDEGDRPMTFAGATTRADFPRTNVLIRFYRSLSTETHLFADESFQFRFHPVGGITPGVGFDTLYVRGAVLPEHRLGLPDRMEDHLFASARRNFRLVGTEAAVTGKLGMAGYTSLAPSQVYFSRRSGFAELDLHTHSDTFEVSMGLMYSPTRRF